MFNHSTPKMAEMVSKVSTWYQLSRFEQWKCFCQQSRGFISFASTSNYYNYKGLWSQVCWRWQQKFKIFHQQVANLSDQILVIPLELERVLIFWAAKQASSAIVEAAAEEFSLYLLKVVFLSRPSRTSISPSLTPSGTLQVWREWLLTSNILKF